MHLKTIILILASLLCFWSCKNKVSQDNTHSYLNEESSLKPLAFTMYSNKTELFVDFKPLIINEVSKFAAHFTVIDELFLPLKEGEITLSLIVGKSGISTTVTEPSAPGIFRLALQPKTVGSGKLIFDIKTKTYTDRIIIDNVTVYPNIEAALKAPTKVDDSGDITYLKEQAWKVDFANVKVMKGAFSNVIKTTGQVLPSPKGQTTISAQVAGILKFNNNQLVQGLSVNKGTPLFYIERNEVVKSNINTATQQARASVNNASKNLERASVLIEDKIISQKEFLEAKKDYEIAQAELQNTLVDTNFNKKNQTVSAPINGFVQSIYVQNGQTVSVGTPLASITTNNQLVLEVNVPQNELNNLSSIQSADFILQNSDRIYNTTQLNGKVIGFSKNIINGSPYVLLTFQINNTDGILAGSIAEVFLKSTDVLDTIVIPISALIEEQGRYYVYVQKGGERFEKREVELGGNNAKNVQILKGLNDGERVVTKGAYQIKLSAASGELPAHGHEH